MATLTNKLVKVQASLKSLEQELLYIRTVLLSVTACVRMIDYEADDEGRSIDPEGLQRSEALEQKELFMVEDLEQYNDLDFAGTREAGGES